METPPPPPPPPSMPTSTVTAYAGFWRRFAAWVIDVLLIGLVTTPITLAMGGFDPSDPGTQTAYVTSPAFPIVTLAQWLYFALMESSSRQATLGKMALGIRVTDLDGNRIGFGKATGRYFAKILSGLILFIGFLMAAFTERKQALHDMLAGTLVVK
jgi:uncharacterized RDD family membrane protein YckC